MIVYMIRNKINGKMYIGLDRKDNKYRWKDHIRHSKKNPIQLIDKKIAQYGLNNFEYVELCKCKTISELKEKEKHFIKEFDTMVYNKKGYNLTSGGDGCFNFKMPLNKIHKGKNHYMYGKKHSKETNEKRSQSMKKHRANSINPFTLQKVRKKLSEIAKQRVGKSNPNYKHGKRCGISAKYNNKI